MLVKFVEYVGAQNKDISAASQMLLTRVRIHLQHKLPLIFNVQNIR